MNSTIRTARLTDLREIKRLVDTFDEIGADPEMFSIVYYERLLRKGILLVSECDNKIIGTCFGSYNMEEGWADMLGLVVQPEYRRKRIGSDLVKEFEYIVAAKGIRYIDLFANNKQVMMYKNLGYMMGRHYIAFRKNLR